ncbi:MAG: DUF4783 domain-containing protein [Flavobacteriales bacterium]|nr:DUF4783 domain-containing protein [Flavobacteriales bacterium]
MKSLMTCLLLFATVVVSAQSDASDKIAKALGAGDAETIGQHLVANVDLAILDDEDMYPHDVVVKKLGVFFSENKPTKFEIKHKGQSKLDDHYRIGDLVTANGKFRVTFFMKKGDNKMSIKQLRIERYE